MAVPHSFAGRGGQRVPARELDENFASVENSLGGKEPTLPEGEADEVLNGAKQWTPLADLPLSDAAIAALANKEPLLPVGSAAQVIAGNKTLVGMADLPISTAAQGALDLRVPVNADVGFDATQRKQGRENVAVYQFATRAEAVAFTYPSDLPDGAIVEAGPLRYVRDAASTAFPDWSGFSPIDANVAHFVADDTGGVDVSAGVNAALSFFSSYEIVPWGTGVYLCDDPLIGFSGKRHNGSAAIYRGTDVFYVGANWDGATNRTYISASGSATADGLTAATALNYVNGFNFPRNQGWVQDNVKWDTLFLAGTYSVTASRRFEGSPVFKYKWVIRGEVDGDGAPLVIFDGDGVNQPIFRTIGDQAWLRCEIRDFKFINFATASAVDINYRFDAYCDNLHFDGGGGTAFNFRNGNIHFRGGSVKNTLHGVNIMDCYGTAGGGSTADPEGGTIYENVSGDALHFSRGTISYARFNHFDGCGTSIVGSRVERFRRQGNVHRNWVNAVYRLEAVSVMNDDLDFPDDISGGSVGKVTHVSLPGSFDSRVHTGLNRLGHLTYNGADITVATGGTRTQLSFAPFRMPGYWLQAPTARGMVTLEVAAPANASVLVEVAGVGSGGTNILSAITIPAHTAALVWRVEIEIQGPQTGATVGRYYCTAYSNGMAQPIVCSFGNTGSLNNTGNAESTNAIKVFRLYATVTGGAGNAIIRRIDTEVAY